MWHLQSHPVLKANIQLKKVVTFFFTCIKSTAQETGRNYVEEALSNKKILTFSTVGIPDSNK